MKYFCTYFNKNYFPQGMTLYKSLQHLEIDFKLFVVCLDEETYDIFEKLNIQEIEAVKLADIERFDQEFAACRKNRSLVEYFFTLSPVMPLYLFEKFPEIDILAYMDADLYFYNSPQPLYDELGESSILIIEHRFPEKIRWREKFGRFNVQFQLYRRDAACLKCLEWWREKCIEWCYDKFDGERFADQKYLDKWPEMFENVIVSKINAAGVAPWNWYNYDITVDDKNNNLTIDGENLIFYHFQGFKVLKKHLLVHNLGHYGKVMPRYLLKKIYIGYLRSIVNAKNMVNESYPKAELSVYTKHNRAGLSSMRTIASVLYHRAGMYIDENL